MEATKASSRTLPSPILITGASGFIGEHLLRRFHRAGRDVVGTWRTRPIHHAGARLMQVDLSDEEETRALFDEVQPRTIIHAAAMTSLAACEEQPGDAYRAIVTASENVARFAPNGSILIGLSTDMVFDGRKGGYSEADPPSPKSTYGRLKWQAEKSIHAHGCVLRTALVYGPPSTHQESFLGWLVQSLRSGGPVVLFEDEIRTPIHVNDLCEAIERLAHLGQRGIWHAGGPDAVSRVEMARLVARTWGLLDSGIRPTRLSDHPSGAIRPADASLDSTRLWKEIGHEPREFKQGIREVFESGAFSKP